MPCRRTRTSLLNPARPDVSGTEALKSCGLMKAVYFDKCLLLAFFTSFRFKLIWTIDMSVHTDQEPSPHEPTPVGINKIYGLLPSMWGRVFIER